MKTIIKSFIGAVAGTLLVLAIAFFFIKKHQPEKTHIIQTTQIEKIPVEQTSYTVAPQCTDFTKAAAKSVDAVVHIKTIIGVKPRYYDNFFGSLRNYF